MADTPVNPFIKERQDDQSQPAEQRGTYTPTQSPFVTESQPYATQQKNILDFDAIKITLASPDAMKEWSHGEVTKPETINYRTLKPEKDGLFDERIFGPTKDWECYCGKYKRIRYRGVICDKCGVEVTESKVRRERMGHITLASPVAHIWFFKGTPSKLSLLLDIPPRLLESVIYSFSYLVIEAKDEKKKEATEHIQKEFERRREGLQKQLEDRVIQLKKEAANDKSVDDKSKKLETELQTNLAKLAQIEKDVLDSINRMKPMSLLTEDEYLKLSNLNAISFFDIDMGAKGIARILESFELDKLVAQLREEVSKTSGQRYLKATKRLRLVESMRQANLRPEWMILKNLPVLPPDLRPMVQLSGGRFASSDLNDLYRRVINRNNRLHRLIDLGAPEIILRNERRMLQEAVDALIDGVVRERRRGRGGELRSLSDMLRGKQGRFRQNLLGKRVDYSGRSVIVVGPRLRLDQVGLPKAMALEMFKPFVLRELISRGFAPNVKSARHILERGGAEVWDILESITHDHPVLLNRAPTLHRLGFQAFYPVLIEGGAIELHPCVCAGYNADFDGDQMAVHIPLSEKAKQEAKDLMLSTRNILKPSDGAPSTVPNMEMAVGCFYLTRIDDRHPIPDTIFADENEVDTAISARKITYQTVIKVRLNGAILETTAGRILFNKSLPVALRYHNDAVKAATIKQLIVKALDLCTHEEVVTLIDTLKDLGFKMVTHSGLSVGIFDCHIYPEKDRVLREADVRVSEVENNYNAGLITDEEKKRLSHEIWIETTNQLADLTWARFDQHDPLKVLVDSGGAKATVDQIKQLCAMRGLMTDPTGKVVELPSKSNFREGLTVFEYFTSTRGARKGMADRALKTAESGYLTRRLVDVAHDAIIRLEDCGADQGILVLRNALNRRQSLGERVLGRVVAADVIDPETKKVVVAKNQDITDDLAHEIDAITTPEIIVRSPLTCEARYGLCQKCYGYDLGTRKMVAIGVPVGVIAAQSIGEPGTQLTMRTFHLGGIVGLDITQGLPRVEELVEARMPKALAPVAHIAGKVSIKDLDDGYHITIRNEKLQPIAEQEYIVPQAVELLVSDGDEVQAGTALTAGHLDVREVLEVAGLYAAQRYIVDEAQKVYELQGVPINDKHFETIVHKMSDKVRIETPGDTKLLPGEVMTQHAFADENSRVMAAGGEPSTAKVVILGITKASLLTESFLSAASFQETTHVLTDASVEGKVDNLLGLKENVIIGRLIPTDEGRARMTNAEGQTADAATAVTV